MPVTIKDVARKAGVGIGTVSRVFNRSPLVSQETQQKVLIAARELGYYPDASARKLVQRKTKILAYIETHSPKIPYLDAFMPEVLRGVHSVALAAGYHILVEPYSDVDNGESRLLTLIREKHADGLILSGPRTDDEIFEELAYLNIPVVLQGAIPNQLFSSVDVNNENGAWEATRHLIHLGHRRIGFISNSSFTYTAAQDRKNGYLRALQEHNLAIDQTIVLSGDFSPESGQIAMEKLIGHIHPPSAVFIASDTVAVGAMRAVFQAGLSIPEDMAVVGFDDIPIAAYMTPPLTSIRLPAQEIGKKAAELLINIVENPDMEKTNILLPTELIIRNSCGFYN